MGVSASFRLFVFFDMDNTFNEKIEKFLSLEKPSDAQIMEGATLLLQLSPGRSRGIYNSAMKRPQAMLPWIRTDLRKHLAIRKRGLTTETVEKYNRETVRKVQQSLSVAPVAVPDDRENVPAVPVLGTRGRRSDHDSLPDDIKQLWDDNVERWKKMRKCHAQLAMMIAKPGYAPCDGNELCYQLRQMDDALRADYAKYDSWKPDSEGKGNEKKVDSVDVFTDNVRTIQNARTAISRGLARKNAHTEESLRKLQEAVDTLFALKQALKEDTIGKLKNLGIVIPVNAKR
jgi:hypothetical protein